HGGQRPAQHRSDGYRHWSGAVVRHAGRARVYDAFGRRIARTLVLVAATSAPAPGQFPTPVVWPASAGSCPAAERATREWRSRGPERPSRRGEFGATG